MVLNSEAVAVWTSSKKKAVWVIMDWMDWIPFVFMGCNLIFAVFVFAFLARPNLLLSKNNSLGAQRGGRVDEYSLPERKVFNSFSVLLLLLLFLTSCITGGVITHVRLYQQSEQIFSR